LQSFSISEAKCSKTHPRTPLISKKITGGRGRGGRGEGEEREAAREGRPPIHIPSYDTGC